MAMGKAMSTRCILSLDDAQLAPYPLRQSLSVDAGKLSSLRASGAAEWLCKPRCL